MNYRHAYHAGNFADVVKHIILTRIVLYMQRKDHGFRVIDTHAGIGRYDLKGTEAGKTGEWQSGIGRLLEAKLDTDVAGLIQPYLDIVRAENPDGAIRHYPGSPLIVRHLLRKQDRLSALELHPDDARLLAELFEGDVQVRVTQLDGWLALGAHLPPKEKRGLILVDPPFEIGANSTVWRKAWSRRTGVLPAAPMPSGTRSRTGRRSSVSPPSCMIPALPKSCARS